MASRRPALVAAVVIVPIVLFCGLLWALGRSQDAIAEGISVAGVPVGGLTTTEAHERLSARILAPARQDVVVRVSDRHFRLKPDEAKVRADIAGAVATARRASDAGALSLGWRKLTGGEVSRELPLRLIADRRAIRSFVSSIAKQVGRKPRNAELNLTVSDVDVTRSRSGRSLRAPDSLRTRIMEALTTPGATLRLRATMKKLEPEVDRDELFERNPTQVTVSRSGRTVRLFRRGEMVKSYSVAVGSAEYPTTEGLFSVQSMQVNPVWNVPNSEWAGDLAGQTIPGGAPNNPLKERWIGFNGGIGFHGSGQTSGGAQSHGCVRMTPGDVIDLYKRVSTGTPVLVA